MAGVVRAAQLLGDGAPHSSTRNDSMQIMQQAQRTWP